MQLCYLHDHICHNLGELVHNLGNDISMNVLLDSHACMLTLHLPTHRAGKNASMYNQELIESGG